MSTGEIGLGSLANVEAESGYDEAVRHAAADAMRHPHGPGQNVGHRGLAASARGVPVATAPARICSESTHRR